MLSSPAAEEAIDAEIQHSRHEAPSDQANSNLRKIEFAKRDDGSGLARVACGRMADSLYPRRSSRRCCLLLGSRKLPLLEFANQFCRQKRGRLFVRISGMNRPNNHSKRTRIAAGRCRPLRCALLIPIDQLANRLAPPAEDEDRTSALCTERG